MEDADRKYLTGIRKLIQKIKCSVPFSFTYFGHSSLTVVRQLSGQSQLIRCNDCGKFFAINHNVRVILPWECVRHFYSPRMAETTGELVMPILETEFEVFCDKCGAGLCMSTTVKGSSIHVEPCECCINEAYQDRYDDGYREGENRNDEN
ncbi:MAG: hypothetical protein WC194_10365 [Mesotoga sp.]|uniref:hypothetical protein n=1 Tax=Mesotoga sp. TaxID=2053577 RepID=UPI00356B556A